MDQRYEIPEDFDPYHYLSTAWGIMGGDPVMEVQLRFSPQVPWRVKEPVWHPSQTIEDLPDGGCVLAVWVSHTLEMKPWIRGWGAGNCGVSQERAWDIGVLSERNVL